MHFLSLHVVTSLVFIQLLRFAQKRGSRAVNVAAVNYAVAAVLTAVILFAMYGVPKLGEHWPAAALGAVAGIGYFTNLLILLASYRMVGVGITVAFGAMGAVIPVLASLFFWHEPLTPLLWVALGLLPAAAFLLRPVARDKKLTLQGDLFLLLVFAAPGIVGTIHKSSAVFAVGLDEPTKAAALALYQAALFLAAAASNIGYVLWRRMHVARRDLLLGSAVGTVNVAATYCIVLGLSLIPAAVFFPTARSCVIAGSVVLSWFLWKERVTSRQIVGLVVAVAVVVLTTVRFPEQSASRPPTSQESIVQSELMMLEMADAAFAANPVPADGRSPGSFTREQGPRGGATAFRFTADAAKGYFLTKLTPEAAWDRTAGLSFEVKGDGSENWGCLVFVDPGDHPNDPTPDGSDGEPVPVSDYLLRYACLFPLDSTEWRRVTVPWCDLIPELPQGAVPDGSGAFAPSRLKALWVGKSWFWRRFPACGFSLGSIRLERTISMDTTDHTPARGGVPRFAAKVAAGKSVSVLTLGDSLSDKRHWSNRKVLWSELMAKRLTQTHGGEVRLLGGAIGGNQLTHQLLFLPRYLREEPRPGTPWCPPHPRHAPGRDCSRRGASSTRGFHRWAWRRRSGSSFARRRG